MPKANPKKLAEWISLARAARGPWRQDQVAAANGWLLAFVQTNRGTGYYVMVRDGKLSVGTYEYMLSMATPTDADFHPSTTAEFTTDKFAWRHLIDTQKCNWLPAEIGCGFDWSQVVKVAQPA
jgi:hypothetical protein